MRPEAKRTTTGRRGDLAAVSRPVRTHESPRGDGLQTLRSGRIQFDRDLHRAIIPSDRANRQGGHLDRQRHAVRRAPTLVKTGTTRLARPHQLYIAS